MPGAFRGFRRNLPAPCLSLTAFPGPAGAAAGPERPSACPAGGGLCVLDAGRPGAVRCDRQQLPLQQRPPVRLGGGKEPCACRHHGRRCRRAPCGADRRRRPLPRIRAHGGRVPAGLLPVRRNAELVPTGHCRAHHAAACLSGSAGSQGVRTRRGRKASCHDRRRDVGGPPGPRGAGRSLRPAASGPERSAPCMSGTLTGSGTRCASSVPRPAGPTCSR